MFSLVLFINAGWVCWAPSQFWSDHLNIVSKHSLTHACMTNIFHHHRLQFVIIIIVIIISVFISTHGDIELRIFVSSEEDKWSGRGQDEGDEGARTCISSYCRQCHMHHHPCSSRKLNITNFHETRTPPTHTYAHTIWIIAFVHWILLLFSNTYITNNNYILSWSCDYHHHPRRRRRSRCRHVYSLCAMVVVVVTVAEAAVVCTWYVKGVFIIWPNTTNETNNSTNRSTIYSCHWMPNTESDTTGQN